MGEHNSNIDMEGVDDLIQQYHRTNDSKEQRQIENEVLSKTVWKEPTPKQEDEFRISKQKVELVYDELPDGAKEAKRVLRSLYVEQL